MFAISDFLLYQKNQSFFRSIVCWTKNNCLKYKLNNELNYVDTLDCSDAD